MRITADQRGATLIEAVVAGGLLVTLATGTAMLVTLARRLGGSAEQLMVATSIAASRVQVLRAIPWHYDRAGAAPEVAALDLAPDDALARDTVGRFEVTDETGRPASAPGAGAASFVVRWATWPAAASSPETRLVEVCVFTWPTAMGASPLVCLGSARTRQP